jgi:alkanesulfonate monooxygenase SsuD/methylene tetrahydromethanopterin reductase-like flavin-dependent oxidoreductase (luciferase family)
VYGVPLPTLPIFEAWTELAAIAAVTENVHLGTLVTPPFFRNPGLLAKQIATVDHVAGGRVIVGLGAGWFQPEFEGYGLPFPALGERMRALDELAQVLPRLFTEERTTFEGRHFQLREAICEPKPPRRPPLLIGGGGEKVLMGIAVRHADVWNNLAVFQPQLEHKVAALRRRCDELGRDPDSIEISQQCVVVIAEDETGARQALAKAQKIYGGHMGAGLEEHGIWGDPKGVIDRIEQHRQLGPEGRDRPHRAASAARLHEPADGVLRSGYAGARPALRREGDATLPGLETPRRKSQAPKARAARRRA